MRSPPCSRPGSMRSSGSRSRPRRSSTVILSFRPARWRFRSTQTPGAVSRQPQRAIHQCRCAVAAPANTASKTDAAASAISTLIECRARADCSI